MDVTPIKLNPGPVVLGVQVEGTSNEPFIVGVSNAAVPRSWYFKRELEGHTQDFTIPLPVHPRKAVLWVSSGKVVSTWQSKLKPRRIPYPKATKKARPYDLLDMQIRAYTRDDMRGPARVWKDRPVMDINPELFNGYPEPTQKFIIAHEQGHHYYDDEEDADAFAAVTLMNKGYGYSQLHYALTKVLGRSPENVKRMIETHRFLKQWDPNYNYG